MDDKLTSLPAVVKYILKTNDTNKIIEIIDSEMKSLCNDGYMENIVV